VFKEHRITARSTKVGKPWFDRRGAEWQRFTCGVTDHGMCAQVISQKTGRREPKS